MLKWKLIMLLFGIKTATCDCSFESKSGFKNARSQSKITKTGNLPPKLNESSGLTFVKENNNFLTHNDSSNESEIFIINDKGELQNTKQYPQLKNNDWEDITTDRYGNIYIGDFGNNSQMRTNLAIYKVNGDKIDTISFRYEDQLTFPPNVKNFDCEAFFWHQNKLYLFSKNWEQGLKTCKLYAIPDQAGNYILQPIDQFVLKTQVTAADINPKGDEFVLLTYGKAIFFGIENGVINFSQPKYCRKTKRMQTEAIAYKNDKQLYFTNEQGKIFNLKFRDREN